MTCLDRHETTPRDIPRRTNECYTTFNQIQRFLRFLRHGVARKQLTFVR